VSAATLTIAFVVGMIFSPLLILGLAPVISGAAKFLIKLGVRSGGDWLLKPVGGTRYELVQVEYDDAEGKAWRSGDDDDEEREYWDDSGARMRTLFGKSFGLAVDDVSSVVDPVDCAVGKAEAKKATDGGLLESATETFSLEEIRDRAHIGTLEKKYQGGLERRIEFINPFVSIAPDDEGANGQVVDVRDSVELLSKNGSPETPRKTAENAAAAERAFDDWSELKRNISLISAFLIGAITAEFIAGSGGGGGGTIGLTLAQPALEMSSILLGMSG
jgi:hypothetical protein